MAPESIWVLIGREKTTKETRAAYAVLSLYWSPSFKIRSLRVTITTKTIGFSLSLTASRIDSIRASQHLVTHKIVLLIANVKSCA